MQCSNCGFQNLPGSEVCGRCTTSLGLATAVMDVHPPRAGSAAKLRRQLFPVHKTWFQMREALATGETDALDPSAASSLPSFSVLVRLIVPGWSQWYLGRRIRGLLFFMGFVAFLLQSLLMCGSGWGNIWLGMTFSVHSSAALDIFTHYAPTAGARERISYSIIVSVLLAAFIYLPCYLVLQEFAQPYTVETALGIFQPDETVLVDRWSAPKRGDVVLYTLPRSYQYPFQVRPGLEGRFYAYAGQNIDRIIAAGGDTVRCERGQLIVNGAPSRWLPLNAGRLPDHANFTVPPGHCLILATGVPGYSASNDYFLWEPAGIVPLDDIAGRVFLRSSPLSRFQVIH